jgi:hypothetical protein
MPITAIPPGVEIRKITAVQKRALDELLNRQKESSLLGNAILVGIPALVVGLGALAYVFKDELKDQIKERLEALPGDIGTGILETGFDLAKDLGATDLQQTTGTAEAIYGEDIDKCSAYEYDLVNLYQRGRDTPGWNVVAKAAIGLDIREKLKGMKKFGCSKPAFVEQKNWDRV